MTTIIDAGMDTLSGGTVTVSNANVQTGDNVMLSMGNFNLGKIPARLHMQRLLEVS